MPELKRNFTQGRMNKDLDERLVPNGEYRDALNVEVNTSEGSDIGTVQTLKGNTNIHTGEILSKLTADSHLFSSDASCVGTISDQAKNKIYWFVTDPHRNYDATYSTDAYSKYDTYQEPLAGSDGATQTTIRHKVYSDYILEYSESSDKTRWVVVEHWKVRTEAAQNSSADGGIIYVSNLGAAGDIRRTGIQVGMEVYAAGVKTSVYKIQQCATAGMNKCWEIHLEHDNNDTGFAQLSTVNAGDNILFKLPHEKRALGFSHFAYKYPGEVITGINIIDNLLFWTDNLTEPKKINIDRCKLGSRQNDRAGKIWSTRGTREYPTLLIVNGAIPSYENGRLGSVTTYPSALPYPFLSYQHTTVIKKSPTTPLKLTMANTTRPDHSLDGRVIVNASITLPAAPSGSDDMFFNSNGVPFVGGDEPNYTVSFSDEIDWEEGDIVYWYTNEADIEDTEVAVMRVESEINNRHFTFSIISASELLIKTWRSFTIKLKQKDPLFEFKFPRFSYRWKYEDGEYSCYAPFSEVAFLPEEFDYLPKKGYNLGMTNNLRYLLLSEFKPRTTPLDVVEIDILYKESNSPNVYTVETIKSPSVMNNNLGTSDFSAAEANAWMGRIKYKGNWTESPYTLTESSTPVKVAETTLERSWEIDSGVYYYQLNDTFDTINIKIGDIMVFEDNQTGLTSPILISGFLNSVDSNGELQTYVSLTANGSAVTDTSNTWLYDGSEVSFKRTVPKKPAIYVGDPQGSFEVKSDMIHAAVPSNQLLRPYDNVPKKAKAQEVTGNRVVYANYEQNFDLISDEKKTTVTRFLTNVVTRSNIRDNVQFNQNTANQDHITGATVDWWDVKNALTPVEKLPERSLKSIRDYQVGAVYMDEFGRQTPIQPSETGLVRLSKEDATNYNSLRVKLDNVDIPAFATHFKFFIKENSNEYYNLAMDRMYRAEDGNVWISFPSSERNKVDEETFLILKKAHDSNTFVKEKARYKILAISNEAPLFVKTKYESYGIISVGSFPTTGEPRINRKFVELKDDVFQNSSWSGKETKEDLVIRITSDRGISRWYDVAGISDNGAYMRVLCTEDFGNDMSFTTDDGTENGTMIPGLSIELARKKIKDLPEFGGRFFVKLYKDSLFEKYVQVSAGLEKDYMVKESIKLGYVNLRSRKCNHWEDVKGKHWFVDKSEADGIHQDSKKDYSPGQGVVPANGKGWRKAPYSGMSWASPLTKNQIDISIHSIGSQFRHTPWTVFNTDQNARIQNQATNLLQGGNMFRFRGDTTIYKISWAKAYSIENCVKKHHSYGYKFLRNHREKYSIEFYPELGKSGVLDAVGVPSTGYNPWTHNAEKSGDFGNIEHEQEWIKGIRSFSNSWHYRTIEFLEEVISDAGFTSNNPAVWETEPKEDVDLDIYHEASSGLPIKKEFNVYLNRFDVKNKHTGWNELSYYNCFSFANGVESNRIRDDFNAVTIDKGPKVSTVLAEQYKEERRKSGLIYSGIYNSISGVNNLNQFIQAEKITKDLNPTYGSIQKLWSKDTNLTALCEDRVINILANKDALFNADGNANVISTNRVLGNAKPYGGDYGISTDPSSFAYDEYRAYFTDKARGAVLRLSAQGLTPISDMGMRDYFKDAFRAKGITLVGSYDDNKGLYNLTIKAPNAETLSTVDEQGDSLTLLNNGDRPTVGNFLGIWFRYGSVTDNWANYVETGGLGNGGQNTAGGTPGNTGLHKRGWAGIQAGSPTHPSGIEHGKPGMFGANPDLTNPITLYFDEITTGYPFSPSIDSTPNWNNIINALNVHGANNVYLYQNHMHRWFPSIFSSSTVNQPNALWTEAHQKETVYSIESVTYDSVKELYEVKVNWLVGLSSYSDVNYFVWSLIGPFATVDTSNVGANDGLNADTSGMVNITASFSEKSKGWTTFQSWLQECGVSLNDKYFTFKKGDFFQHHHNETRNNFYGIQSESSVCVIFNDIPSSVKHFSSLNYEGSQSRVLVNTTDDQYYNNDLVKGWFSSYIETDLETGFIPEFIKKEGKWFNFIRSNKSNNITNFDPKTFSTQGIGRLSTISSVVSSTDNTSTTTAATSSKLTVQDTGDTD